MLASKVLSRSIPAAQSAAKMSTKATSVALAPALSRTSGKKSPEMAVDPAAYAGEELWCKVYGMDYKEELQRALEESDVVVQSPMANAVERPVINRIEEKEIWSMVFSTDSARLPSQ